MKKFLHSSLLIFIFFSFNFCFGISQNFKFVIDTIGIPQYNVYGYEINEDIYYTYNVFSYGSPLQMFSITSTQRFKAVADNGKWTKDGGPYKGSGIRGEYYVLGTSYSGSIIDNVYFPVDYVPTSTPDKWRYVEVPGAYESWNDKSKYKYIEQLEYMKNTSLLFDQIDLVNHTSNSYNLISYGINANKIGLSKARLNTCSTWKTMGVVSTRIMNSGGRIGTAIFATSPMAANADVKSVINVENVYNMDENQDQMSIPINFGADAMNLNNYANKNHIKEICAIIYINGKEYARVSGSKTVSVGKDIIFAVSRGDIKTPRIEKLEIKVESYLYTEFSVDGLLQDCITKNITINIPSKKIVPIQDFRIGLLKKQNNSLVISPLVQTNETNIENSKGVLENGRNIAVGLKLNFNTDDDYTLNLYINDKKVNYNKIYDSGTSRILEINISGGLENTLASWKYLRDKTKDYLSINFDKIGTRVKKPNVIKLEITLYGNIYTYTEKFDNIDDFRFNMGYILEESVLNNINKCYKLGEWI